MIIMSYDGNDHEYDRVMMNILSMINDNIDDHESP